MLAKEGIIFNGIQNSSQLISKEDGDNSRRRLVCTETMIISCAGNEMCIRDRYYDGRIVRKDLTKSIREGANVPVYVLEYLLGPVSYTHLDVYKRQDL